MHFPLIFFTLFSQMAIGAFLFREIFRSFPEELYPETNKKLLPETIILLISISLVAAFFHLGRPLSAINAFRNLGSSWLSREILFLLLFTLFASLKFMSETRLYKKVRLILTIAAIISGLLFLLSMIMVYFLPSVKSWHTIITPGEFILTTLLSGLCLVLVLNKSYRKINFILLRFLIIISALVCLVSLFLIASVPLLLTIIRLLIFLLVFIITYFEKSFNSLNNYKLSGVLMFILILIAEFMGRYSFFLSFEKSGL